MKRLFAVALVLMCIFPCQSVARGNKGAVLSGRVSDTQGNPIAGVYVSDGFAWSQTDASGKYSIISPNPGRVRFVSARIPSGYRPVLREGRSVFYAAVPEYSGKKRRADIVLEKAGDNGDSFTMLMFADPQFRPYNRSTASENFAYASSDVFEDLIAQMRRDLPSYPGPCYGMCLGDIAHTTPEVYPLYCRGTASLGIPFFNVIGNHDHFVKKAGNDDESAAAYESFFGPRNYSFDLGQIHFVVMYNAIDINCLRRYPMVYGYEDEFLEWLKGDLERVPEDMPVMICNHANVFTETDVQHWVYDNIPSTHGLDEFLSVIQGFQKLYVWAGHSHIGGFIGPVRSPANPSAVESFVVSRSTGYLPGNEYLSSDGTPQGYVVLEVNGKDISWKYRQVMDFQAPYRGGEAPAFSRKQALTEAPVQFFAYSRGEYDDDFVYANVFLWDPTWPVPVLTIGERSYPMVRDYVYDLSFKEIVQFYKTRDSEASRIKQYADHMKRHHFRVRVPEDASGKGVVSVTDRFGRTWSREVSVDPITYTDGLTHLAFDFRNVAEGSPFGGRDYVITMSSGRYVSGTEPEEGYVCLSGEGSSLALPAIPGLRLSGVSVHNSGNTMRSCSAQIVDPSGKPVRGGEELTFWGDCSDSWTLEKTEENTSYSISSVSKEFRIGSIRLVYKQ